MAEYKIQGETLTAIADAIRSKVGANATFTPAQMAGAINSVQLQEKTVTPTTEVQTVTPDSGYFGLSKVTVNAAEGGGGNGQLPAFSYASGCIPDYEHGYADSTIILSANIGKSNAVGVLK